MFAERLIIERFAPISIRELCHLTPSRDVVTKTIRTAQLYALIRLVPVTVGVNFFNAIIVATALYGTVADGPLFAWLAAILGFCGWRLVRAWRLRHDPIYTARHPTSIWTISAAVGILALLWTVPALFWFAQATELQRLLIALVVIGTICGASVTMASVPLAALTYITILSVAAIAVMVDVGAPWIALLCVMFTGSIGWAVISSARQFVGHLRARIELEEQSQLVNLLREFEASGSDWLWELDGDLRLCYMSKAMAETIGRPVGELIGHSVFMLLDPTRRIAEVSSGMRAVMDNFRNGIDFRDVAVPTMGGTRWWALSGKRMIDDNGAVIGWRGVGSDITEVRLRGGDATHSARCDPLTGIANRLLVREMVEEALMRQWNGDADCALLLIDLDRFKTINDTLGHAIGDQLLVQVARRLEKLIGSDGSVGRLGGDEFAVVWHGSAQQALLGGLARQIIAELSRPYTIGVASMHIGASIGIACGPGDGAREEALMRGADLALYRAKEAGRGTFAFFERFMLERAEDHRLLENDVRDALQADGFTLAYQPIVDAVTGTVVCREALLRWNHPTRGPISPDVFIPIIEDAGLIHQIGGWVIREACREAASWPEPMRIAVNISAAQLGGAGLAQTVVNALGAGGLAPSLLELEVTESIFLGDDPATLQSLDRLRSIGVRLVLDDFGKGYSSFGYLSRARFAKIKIDQQFVRDAAAGDQDCHAIVTAIVALAQGLGVETTAEGVETAQQAEVMRSLGCTQLQGFHFGRPVPPSDFAQAEAQVGRRTA